MKYSEETLKAYAAPLSETEDLKCRHAIEMIRDALSDSRIGLVGKIEKGEGKGANYRFKITNYFGTDSVTVLIQGSYANNTNIKSSSDVDIAVINEGTFYTKYREGVSDKDYGFSSADIETSSFKDKVEVALRAKLGADVVRHDKSIRVSGNTYRKDADVVPAYRYRDYSQDFLLSSSNYVGGIEIFPDSGGRIINYPEQHLKLGREKNIATNHVYKKVVRVAKNITNDMQEHGIVSASPISSFAIESLFWNVPDSTYLQYTSILKYATDEAISYLFSHQDDFFSFKEANGIKAIWTDCASTIQLKDYVTSLKEWFEYDI